MCGQIWGQKDTIPGRGEMPTTGWLEGEVVRDALDIAMNPDSPAGQYHIRLGWYDGNTGQRLQTLNAQGQPIGDSAILEESIVLN